MVRLVRDFRGYYAWKEKDREHPTLTEQPELLQVKLVMKFKMENELAVGLLTELEAQEDKDFIKDFLKDCMEEFGVELTVMQVDIVMMIDNGPELSAQKIAQKVHVSEWRLMSDDRSLSSHFHALFG